MNNSPFWTKPRWSSKTLGHLYGSISVYFTTSPVSLDLIKFEFRLTSETTYFVAGYTGVTRAEINKLQRLCFATTYANDSSSSIPCMTWRL